MTLCLQNVGKAQWPGRRYAGPTAELHHRTRQWLLVRPEGLQPTTRAASLRLLWTTATPLVQGW